MATLPTVSNLTDASTTNAQQKTNFSNLRTFLADLLGTDSSNKAAARAALNVPYSPTGALIQGGTALTDSNGSVAVTFPTAYTGTPHIVASPIVASYGTYAVNITGRNAGGFTANITVGNTGAAGLNLSWIAVGV